MQKDNWGGSKGRGCGRQRRSFAVRVRCPCRPGQKKGYDNEDTYRIDRRGSASCARRLRRQRFCSASGRQRRRWNGHRSVVGADRHGRSQSYPACTIRLCGNPERRLLPAPRKRLRPPGAVFSLLCQPSPPGRVLLSLSYSAVLRRTERIGRRGTRRDTCNDLLQEVDFAATCRRRP